MIWRWTPSLWWIAVWKHCILVRETWASEFLFFQIIKRKFKASGLDCPKIYIRPVLHCTIDSFYCNFPYGKNLKTVISFLMEELNSGIETIVTFSTVHSVGERERPDGLEPCRNRKTSTECQTVKLQNKCGDLDLAEQCELTCGRCGEDLFLYIMCTFKFKYSCVIYRGILLSRLDGYHNSVWSYIGSRSTIQLTELKLFVRRVQVARDTGLECPRLCDAGKGPENLWVMLVLCCSRCVRVDLQENNRWVIECTYISLHNT